MLPIGQVRGVTFIQSVLYGGEVLREVIVNIKISILEKIINILPCS